MICIGVQRRWITKRRTQTREGKSWKRGTEGKAWDTFSTGLTGVESAAVLEIQADCERCAGEDAGPPLFVCFFLDYFILFLFLLFRQRLSTQRHHEHPTLHSNSNIHCPRVPGRQRKTAAIVLGLRELQPRIRPQRSLQYN